MYLWAPVQCTGCTPFSMSLYQNSLNIQPICRYHSIDIEDDDDNMVPMANPTVSLSL